MLSPVLALSVPAEEAGKEIDIQPHNYAEQRGENAFSLRDGAEKPWQHHTEENYEHRQHAPAPDPFEQLETRGIVAEYLLRAVGLRGALAEITVAQAVLQILPAAIGKELHIFFLVRQSVRVIIELVDHVLRLAFFKMVYAERRQPDKFPAMPVHLTQVVLLLFPVHNAEKFYGLFRFHVIFPPARCGTAAQCARSPFGALPAPDR